ncbi:MAG TPA: 5-formyltetrahydrofolate cyclo-ligase [Micromonosporaceae bacterium]
MSAKQELRLALLSRRRALSAGRRATADTRVESHVHELVRRRRPRRVTAYVPVGSEPGGALPRVIEAALGGGGELLLPVLLPDLDLDWAVYRGPESLVAAGRGLREPTGPRLGPAAVGAADLVVVPALAVDRRGVRLGRGGGSYDRALARVDPAALVVALLHDGELIDRVPAQPHDRTVTAVITPTAGLCVLPAE